MHAVGRNKQHKEKQLECGEGGVGGYEEGGRGAGCENRVPQVGEEGRHAVRGGRLKLESRFAQ